MKKYRIYLLAVASALLSSVALTSCDDDATENANDVLAVKSVLPTKIMEGQVVTITGTGLDDATAVVFPGNIKVTDIAKVGSGYITVVTPAGVDANGGGLIVETNDASVESAASLSVGSPKVARVAPLDKEIKINECLEVYGSDLEFIENVIFPGADGNDIVVSADQFRRKSTSTLLVYSPMGIAAGAAVVKLQDCSGKKTELPEVALSDKVAGGESGPTGEGYYVVWEGSEYVQPDWANWLYLGSDQFNLDGIALSAGTMIRFTFDNPSAGTSVCVCDGNWGAPDADGNGNNTVWCTGTELEFPMSQGMVDTFKGGGGIIVGGSNFTLTKIEIFRSYPTIFSGEHETGWWWYMTPAELDLSAVTPEAGQTIRFTFAPHTSAQTFCLCDGWWGAPYIGEGGPDPNNVPIAPDQDYIEFEISEGMANTMNQADGTALIIGGEVVITKIQIITF